MGTDSALGWFLSPDLTRLSPDKGLAVFNRSAHSAGPAMNDGKWEIGDGRWQMGDGRWDMRDGRWEMGAWRIFGFMMVCIKCGLCKGHDIPPHDLDMLERKVLERGVKSHGKLHKSAARHCFWLFFKGQPLFWKSPQGGSDTL